MTTDRTAEGRAEQDAITAAFAAHDFAATAFRTEIVGPDGGSESIQVSGYACDGLGVHEDGDYWRIVALGTGAPLGLMPTVSATIDLCTQILSIPDYHPAGADEPGSDVFARIRDMQAQIVAEEAEALRQRADELADEISYLEEKANDFQARAMFGALQGFGAED
ncbi:hypothetical protein ACFOGJ_19200 [Marinibaculum pumilum]|uniref:Uncharacterized protein n=1 Tax=Marinibaculum pumilum TaxID=1766165 RepID=A0ABV7L548_9PROT